MRQIWLEYWGQVTRLPQGETLVGRARRCRLRFSDPTVSRVHLRITVTNEQVIIEDLDSRGGSWVNGELITEPRVLTSGDVVRVGSREFTITEQSQQSLLTDELPSIKPRYLLDGDAAHEFEPDQPTGGHHIGRPVVHAYRPRNPTEPVPIDEGADRRRARRVRTSIAALYVSEGLLLHGVVRDLSERGMFIASDLLDAPGTECQVDLLLEDAHTRTFQGIVRHVINASTGRSGRPPGFGIEFFEVADETRSWLRNFLKDQVAQDAE